jgi:SAM-dependent methyltransferase
MEAAEYGLMADAEERMWWYRGLHAHLVAWTGVTRPGPALRLLDAGCGTGGVLRRLRAEARRDLIAVGLDFDAGACRHTAAKADAGVVGGSIDRLPFADASFDLVLSADVLCQREVEEGRALAEFARCLAPDGRLLLNLPAYEWLFGAHDRHVHNARRYTRSVIAARLADVGLRVLRATHWNTLPFPLMVVRRKLMPDDGASDVKPYPPPVEAVFGCAMAIERAAIGAGLDLPFGGSVLVEATHVRH